jgi:hypothetical protein
MPVEAKNIAVGIVACNKKNLVVQKRSQSTAPATVTATHLHPDSIIPSGHRHWDGFHLAHVVETPATKTYVSKLS